MAGVCKKKLPSGKRRGWFINWKGEQEFFTHRGEPNELQKMADAMEAEHNKIRVGYAPPPKSSDTPRVFENVAKEYLAWGKSQGGHGGRPWSLGHLHMRTTVLEWWQSRIGLKVIADLDGILPRIEQALRELQTKGRTDLAEGGKVKGAEKKRKYKPKPLRG